MDDREAGTPIADMSHYTYEELVALGVEMDAETGEWWVPYRVLFPKGSTLDWLAEGEGGSSQGTPSN